MPRLALRLDMRHIALTPEQPAARYAAAIEMCAWAEHNGFEFVLLSEHHGREDNYLPSPLTLAAAIAARTSRIRVRIALLVAAFHDPLRVAEDLAVLDLVSNGRLDVTVGAGYVPSEFHMFDRRLQERARRVEEMVEVLKQAWTGEMFDYRGRSVRVRPVPAQRPRPRIDLGGSSEAAGRRAARIADGYFPSTPAAWQPYRSERLALTGIDPGPCPWPGPGSVHVSRDADGDWARMAPFALHEANDYKSMADEMGTETGFNKALDSDTLRRGNLYQILTPEECTDTLSDLPAQSIHIFGPLVGGLPTALAWSSLQLLEREVLPRLRRSAG
jgi:alkanesulfonate monooxygenase SsuD/methylene tetrahydromethanopterin reductase-like flavin-dependent oxidoreductase (luciferase family)